MDDEYKYSVKEQNVTRGNSSRESMKFFVLVALFGLSLAQHNPNLKHGRTSIVHLFEWRWTDIAAECERFLGPNGFGGVQVGLNTSLAALS